jgi:hypothetical protein
LSDAEANDVIFSRIYAEQVPEIYLLGADDEQWLAPPSMEIKTLMINVPEARRLVEVSLTEKWPVSIVLANLKKRCDALWQTSSFVTLYLLWGSTAQAITRVVMEAAREFLRIIADWETKKEAIRQHFLEYPSLYNQMGLIPVNGCDFRTCLTNDESQGTERGEEASDNEADAKEAGDGDGDGESTDEGAARAKRGEARESECECRKEEERDGTMRVRVRVRVGGSRNESTKGEEGRRGGSQRRRIWRRIWRRRSRRRRRRWKMRDEEPRDDSYEFESTTI